MADIELVIKIPEEIRLALINNIQLSMDQQSIYDSYVQQAIINGTPLPTGHGKIIDVNDLLEEMRATRTYDIPFALERIKPIIKVDKEQEDGNGDFRR